MHLKRSNADKKRNNNNDDGQRTKKEHRQEVGRGTRAETFEERVYRIYSRYLKRSLHNVSINIRLLIKISSRWWWWFLWFDINWCVTGCVYIRWMVLKLPNWNVSKNRMKRCVSGVFLFGCCSCCRRRHRRYFASIPIHPDLIIIKKKL